jgi:hypothetical protein
VLGRILAAIVAVATLVVGLVFSVFLFAAALLAGIAVFAWLWWKIRRALKQARQDPRFQSFQDGAANSRGPQPDGEVIEGEVIHEEWKER